jgi:RNA polymerase sigma factor (TIGR02999 family)
MFKLRFIASSLILKILLRKSVPKAIMFGLFFLEALGALDSREAAYNPATGQPQFYQYAQLMSDTHDVTGLLAKWAQGDTQALGDLTPIVYKELRQLAASYLRRESHNHTLQPTALVHEAYLRLVDQKGPRFENRSHFFGVAARLMRQILVDHARRKRADKRTGLTVSLEGIASPAHERGRDLLALDSSLDALEKLDPRKGKAIELRYFAGLSMDEIAQVLQVSAVTVRRDLRMAEAWLQKEMQVG